MKAIQFLRAAIVLVGILLSACASSVSSPDQANVSSDKPLAKMIFTGVIESMSGDQWVIGGQTIKVDASVLRDGSYQVGDRVKVEASATQDGSVVAQRLESPSGTELVEMATSAPEAASIPQGVVFDHSGTEAVGTVDAITDTSITVGGQTFPLASGVEIKGEIMPGAVVKLHFAVNADGSLSVTEVMIADPTQLGEDHGNDDDSHESSVSDNDANDDNGNDTADNSNDDHGDNGNNTDDDHGNDNNSNDDHSSDSNNNG